MVWKWDGRSLFECDTSILLWEDRGNRASDRADILTGLLMLSQPAQYYLYIGRQNDRTVIHRNSISINVLLPPSESTPFIIHTSSYHSTPYITGVGSIVKLPTKQNKYTDQVCFVIFKRINHQPRFLVGDRSNTSYWSTSFIPCYCIQELEIKLSRM
jgi:hypothetical protein